MVLAVTAVFLLSFLVCFALIPVARTASRRLGWVDEPGPRKVHQVPTPYGGGVAVFLAFASTIIVSVIAIQRIRSGWSPPGLSPSTIENLRVLAEGVMKRLLSLIVIIAGGLGLLILGFIGDRRSISYRIKFAFEAAVAFAVVVSGTRMTLFLKDPLISGLLSVIWLVAMTNAFNLLDNMDGLCSGTTLIAGGLLVAVAAQTHQWFVIAMALSLLGAVAAFFIFNFPPAKIFLGDAGSLFLGYMMGTLAMLATFYTSGQPAFSVLMPILILAVPIFDTASVIVIRVRNGTPVFQGDMNHFSHRLVALGMSQRQAVLFTYLVALALGLMAIVLPVVPLWGAILIGVQAVAILSVIIILEVAGKRRRA